MSRRAPNKNADLQIKIGQMVQVIKLVILQEMIHVDNTRCPSDPR